MSKLQIANTFFEWELETSPKCALLEAFHQHEIFRQLQFLPFLYADPSDGILLADLPGADYKGLTHLQMFTLSDSSFSPFTEIESWGPSQLVADFAKKYNLNYQIPEWELVRQVNSKRFSFECSPKLPHAALLENETQAKDWLQSFEGDKVLKNCYGVSGKGHLIIDGPQFPLDQILAFLKKEWKKGLPVIAEPWVQRVFDFSTQWLIEKSGDVIYIGSTLCENDKRGHYLSNTVGEESILFKDRLPFLKEHRQVATSVLSKIAKLGYFGNIGIDAMVCTLPDQPPILHPIVEINARKTMGWAALAFQKKHCQNHIVRFCFAPSNKGYLPEAAISRTGKITSFRRNLTMAIS